MARYGSCKRGVDGHCSRASTVVTEFAPVRPGFAFGLGTATFFAPCAFPLLPGYVAFDGLAHVGV